MIRLTLSELDCGLLSQNIMLSAESFKLGTCALGNLARAILKIPQKRILFWQN